MERAISFLRILSNCRGIFYLEFKLEANIDAV